jgi:hypothetical protein
LRTCRGGVVLVLLRDGGQVDVGSGKVDTLLRREGTVVDDAGHRMKFTTNPEYATKCDDKIMYLDYQNITKVLGRSTSVPGRLTPFFDERVPLLTASTSSSSWPIEMTLNFGVKNGVDMVFASFIRRGQDVTDIRAHLGEDGKNITSTRGYRC